MTRRLRKKFAVEFASAVTVAVVLDHARPSFYREGRRKRAQLLRWAARTKLGCSRAKANAAKRTYLRAVRS